VASRGSPIFNLIFHDVQLFWECTAIRGFTIYFDPVHRIRLRLYFSCRYLPTSWHFTYGFARRYLPTSWHLRLCLKLVVECNKRLTYLPALSLNWNFFDSADSRERVLPWKTEINYNHKNIVC
jgi:hypothetical protein